MGPMMYYGTNRGCEYESDTSTDEDASELAEEINGGYLKRTTILAHNQMKEGFSIESEQSAFCPVRYRQWERRGHPRS